MGNLLTSYCDGSHGRKLGLSDDPLEWSEEDRIRAARAMFDRYDADDSGTIDTQELSELFNECHISLADFDLSSDFVDEKNFEELVKAVYQKHNLSYNSGFGSSTDAVPLSFEQFRPIFNEMISVMSRESSMNKSRLTGITNLITEAMGEVHCLIVSLDYRYNQPLQLTGVNDGKNIEKYARSSGVADIVTLYDTEHSLGSSMFPHSKNVKREIEKMGRRCKKGDVFLFFYSGHGLNVPDLDGDESDGEDEAFACPDIDGDLTAEDVLVDDDFARYIDKYIPKECKVLVITDCCHSGSICDVDSFAFKHQIIALASAQDNQTSLDMSSFGREGGILTTAIGDTLKEYQEGRYGNSSNDYNSYDSYGGGNVSPTQKAPKSVHEIYNSCLEKTTAIAEMAKHNQKMNIQTRNITPAEFPWPLKGGTW